MSPARKDDTLKGRIDLEVPTGDEPAPAPPNLSIHLLDAEDRAIGVAPVRDDGTFEVERKLLAEARRVVMAPADTELQDVPQPIEWRPATFEKLVAAGAIDLPVRQWWPLITRKVCISAEIRRCFPYWHLLADLVRPSVVSSIAELDLGLIRPAGPGLVLPHFRRCAPVCEGVVEVYRRRCCCHLPPIPIPIPDLPPHLPHDGPIPIPPRPGPDPVPLPPGPGPDPAPFALLDRVLTGGAIDERKLNRDTDRVALQTLTGEALERFLHLRPYLWCQCGPPVKVGEGFVGEGGQIHVCWREPWWFPLPRCHDEYAFVVRQRIGTQVVTIYDGPAAGQWFDRDDDIELTSYHLRAIACRGDDFPVDPGSPFVVLQDIGATRSYLLRTPLPLAGSDDAVQPPSAGLDGLLQVGADAYGLGGDLQLRYHFSESMRTVGARYYRVQVAPASEVTGAAIGPWETVPVPQWATFRNLGAGQIEPGSKALGPKTKGAFNDLYDIPYNSGDPLDGNEEWQDGQYHAVFSSASVVEGRYLVRIEVFDQNGVRLESGAAFSYERWVSELDLDPVGQHEGLCHLLWVDNRAVVADILDVVGPGSQGGNCKFFVGDANDPIAIEYLAYHPQAVNPSFLLGHHITISRGINDPAPTSFSPPGPVGNPPNGPGSVSATIGALLDGEPKCSFAVNLSAWAKIHNGHGRLSNLDRFDVAAFAAELA